MGKAMEEKYRDIIAMIRREGPVRPPADITERIMTRISALQPSAPSRADAFLTYLKGIFPDLKTGNLESNSECSFYFLLSGVFYLILGAVLSLGLSGTSLIMMRWIRWQPEIMLMISLLFITLGFALARGGKAALRTVKSGTFFYIIIAIINGASMQITFNSPRLLSLGFILTNVVMGVLLIMAVKRTAGSIPS